MNDLQWLECTAEFTNQHNQCRHMDDLRWLECSEFTNQHNCAVTWHIVAKRIRALDSSSGVSDEQSLGSIPDRNTCVLKQDT